MNPDNLIQHKEKAERYDNATIFEVTDDQIKAITLDLKNQGLKLKLITATDERMKENCFKVWYVFGAPKEHKFIVVFIKLRDTEQFSSISGNFREALSYERKIKTFFGLIPAHHPDQRPIILHENWPEGVHPLRKDFAWNKRPKAAKGKYEFQEVKGEGIYEIPVGPIHAGIIEPGHFRFSMAGEEIVLLEPRLGYVHKGSEKLFEILPLNDKIKLSEKISGDSSFSHSMAFCQALEQLSDVKVSKRAGCLRVIFAELERMANHFGDIGAIMTDTGFNFGGAQGARLREIVMRVNERLSGSRFLRGINVLGGVTKDINVEEQKRLIKDLENLSKDFFEVVEVADNSASLLNRLRGTGVLTNESALEGGALGIAAKATGIENDTRIDFPYAAYDELRLEKIETEQSGDVNARFRVRIKEVYASMELIKKVLHNLPTGSICEKNVGVLKKNTVVLSVVEGWRGEILYFVKTDDKGNIERVAPRDPSFINWSLLGYAGLNNIVPDFPLINKSFNLSYTGNDL